MEYRIFNNKGEEIFGHNLTKLEDIRKYVDYIGGHFEERKGPPMSMTRGFFDDGMGWYDDYPGYYPQNLRPHEYLLEDAKYMYWSKSDARGYQYLADCYNKFARKDGEKPLLPPPAYL